jgi:hypothetical protein
MPTASSSAYCCATWIQQAFLELFAAAVGVELTMKPLGFRVMWAIGKGMDVVSALLLRRVTFPLSEAIVYLMYANNAYVADKARELVGFEPRPAEQTFGDHFQDLMARGLIASPLPRRDVSIW